MLDGMGWTGEFNMIIKTMHYEFCIECPAAEQWAASANLSFAWGVTNATRGLRQWEVTNHNQELYK
jgi:hypothetical protein